MSEQNHQPAPTILSELLTIAAELWYALDAIYAAQLVPEDEGDSKLLAQAQAVITQAHADLIQCTTPACPAARSLSADHLRHRHHN